MYYGAEPEAPALRHPDDISSLASGASLAQQTAISVNPWFHSSLAAGFPLRPPEQASGQPAPKEEPSLSRASYVAEPPTDPSRARALQQATHEEASMRPSQARSPSPTLPQLALGQFPPPAVAPATKQTPFVDLQRPLNGESEFDRLVREKLEGQHTDRAHLKSRVRSLAEGHLAWQWQALDAVLESGVAVWEGLRSGGHRLLGTLPDIEAAATCKRITQAKPIVIDLDDEEGDGTQPNKIESRDPGDEFRDLVASAAREPIPARIPRAEAISHTPQGTEGLTVSEPAASTLDAEGVAAPKKARPGDAKSCLAPSTAMTSSAASSLGALFSKGADRRPSVEESGVEGLATVKEDEAPKPKQSSKAKSVLAQSTVMSSSAAGALGGLLAKSSARPPEKGIEEDEEPAGEVKPKQQSGAKSVLNQSSAMTSSAAGALSGLLAQGAAKAPPTETSPPPRTSPPAAEEAQAAPPPKKASGAKSVLNQSTAMTSSAAGALGGLLAQGAAKAPPAATGPSAGASESQASSSSAAPPPKKASGAKSVLNQSTAMTSSAAGALGALAAKGGPKAPPARPSQEVETAAAPEAAPKRRPDDRKSALAASSVMTSSAAATLGALTAPPKRTEEPVAKPEVAVSSASATTAPPAAKPKAARPKGESKTVISGLNTSSAASALLGPMVQAKK